jgi:hypothetical protein
MTAHKGTVYASRNSCWDCKYQQLAGDTSLASAQWFSKHKREKDKEIPPEVVDVGCKLFVQRGM